MKIEELKELRKIIQKHAEKCGRITDCENCIWNTSKECDCGLNLFLELVQAEEREVK